MTDDDQALWRWCLERWGWKGLEWIPCDSFLTTVHPHFIGCHPVMDKRKEEYECPRLLTDRNASIAWVQETLTEAQQIIWSRALVDSVRGSTPWKTLYNCSMATAAQHMRAWKGAMEDEGDHHV